MQTFDHVSASQIDTFGDCRRKWWFQSILGIRPPPKASAALGTDVHAVLEAYILTGALLPPTLAGKVAAAGLPFTKPAGDRPLLVELDMATHPANRRTLAGIAVHGRIDVLDLGADPVLVQDWKTTSALKWAKTEDELRFNAQAILYGRFALDLAAHEGRPADRVRFAHVVLLTKGAPKAVKNAVDLDAAHLDAEYRRLDRVVATMRATATATKPSEVPPTESACAKFDGCYFRDRCKALGSFGRPLQGTATPDMQVTSQEDKLSNPAIAALNALRARKGASGGAAAPTPTPTPDTGLAGPARATDEAPPVGAGSAVVPPDAGAESDLSRPPSTWTGDARLLFEERAAIREYVGRQPRTLAEHAAARDVRAMAAAPIVAAEPPPPSTAAAEPAPVSVQPSAPAVAVSPAPVAAPPVTARTPLVLYIDCYPQRGIQGAIVHLEDHIAPMQRKVAEKAGVAIYSLVEYGKGQAYVAAMLMENPPVGNVYVNSRLPASAAALEVLLPLAVGVVRGH